MEITEAFYKEIYTSRAEKDSEYQTTPRKISKSWL